MRRIRIWVTLLYQYILSLKCVKKAKLLSARETVDVIKKSGKSLIRLGDGELNIVDGKDVHYQEATQALSKEMYDLIEYYLDEGSECEYLLCMPNEFLRCNGIKLAKKRVWVASWARFRYVFRKRYDKAIDYGEAFLFARNNEEVYREIWRKKEQIIFVHNNEQYAKAFAEQYAKEVHFISVPAKNSYQEIDIIVQSICDTVANKIGRKEKAVVLLSAGPCAKAIVYRLKNLGIQIVDTGHCWDEPLTLREA